MLVFVHNMAKQFFNLLFYAIFRYLNTFGAHTFVA
jgi:hypothetical protein